MTPDGLPRRGALQSEPPPLPGLKRVWGLALDYLLDRVVAGRLKYGTFLETHNGRNSLKDARDEAADLVFYLTQAIEEQDCAAARLAHLTSRNARYRITLQELVNAAMNKPDTDLQTALDHAREVLGE